MAQASASDQEPDNTVPAYIQLKEIITRVLSQKLNSDRCRKMQEFGKRLVAKITAEDEATISTMSEFTTALLEILDGILQEASTATVCALQRERAWTKFHQIRCTSISRLWADFLSKLKVFGTNSLLVQSVTQEIFEERMQVSFPCKVQGSHGKGIDEEITEDEKNIIMYACGYVPVTLIHRYEKRREKKYASFV